MDHSLPGSSVHGTSEARILEWVAISCSRGSSWLRDWTYVSCTGGQSIFWFLLFSHSVTSHSLQPHGLQHAKLPYPSLSPRAWSNSCSLCRWCHPAISSFVIPFSSCPQSFPASGSFPMSQLFASSWPRYWTFIFSISHFNEYSRLISFRIHWFYLLMPKGLSRVFSGTTVGKHRFFSAQPS